MAIRCFWSVSLKVSQRRLLSGKHQMKMSTGYSQMSLRESLYTWTDPCWLRTFEERTVVNMSATHETLSVKVMSRQRFKSTAKTPTTTSTIVEMMKAGKSGQIRHWFRSLSTWNSEFTVLRIFLSFFEFSFLDQFWKDENENYWDPSSQKFNGDADFHKADVQHENIEVFHDDSWDMNDDCPAGCDCATNVVDCGQSKQKLTSLPYKIPKMATHLDMNQERRYTASVDQNFQTLFWNF